MRIIRTVLFTVLLCCGATSLAGQTPAADPDVPGSQIRVALVTIGPGALVWDRFGHNAIWIQDPERRIDLLYNYGTYDFDAENFILRFIQGRMLYELASGDPDTWFRYYRSVNRSIWVQELNFTPAQRIELRDFLLWNDLPENRDYRYDYYYDNCSTRIRDALDQVLGGPIRRQTERRPLAATFRFHTQRLTSNNVWYYTGLLMALGPLVDRSITAWDEMFLPMSLRDHLRNVTVLNADGSVQPVVASERTLFESTALPASQTPPAWLFGYLVVGLVLAGGLLWLGGNAAGSERSRVGFAALATSWTFLVGVLGTVLFGIVTATDHTAAYWNENLFLFNPLSLALAVAVPLVVAGVGWIRRPAVVLAVAVAGLSALGFVAQALPWLDQVNGQLYALVLLPNIAVGVGVYRLSRGAGSREQGAVAQ